MRFHGIYKGCAGKLTKQLHGLHRQACSQEVGRGFHSGEKEENPHAETQSPAVVPQAQQTPAARKGRCKEGSTEGAGKRWSYCSFLWGGCAWASRHQTAEYENRGGRGSFHQCSDEKLRLGIQQWAPRSYRSRSTGAPASSDGMGGTCLAGGGAYGTPGLDTKGGRPESVRSKGAMDTGHWASRGSGMLIEKARLEDYDGLK
eukprot:8418891-Karenia_brevis.AAC.1